MCDKIQKIILFSISFLLATGLQAQISIGLKESALGNSGAAITESSAPSFYNPALLSERQKSYFSITGTTLTNYRSSSDAGDFNSTKFAPNYISSIHAFETYVHEFSLVNQVSLDSRTTAAITDGTKSTSIKNDQYNLAYSFAFRDFPFGFQVGVRVSEQNARISQATNDGNIATGVDFDIAQKFGHLFAGFGGIHQLGANYRFGYKYESPGLDIYKKTEQSGNYYYYDKGNNLFTAGQTEGTAQNENFNLQSLALGHSFAWGDHEMLTDTRFTENPEIKNKYNYYQTFGYKVNFSNKMQYMCGFAHDFDAVANYFSTGFTWQTNALRSTVSAYYAEDQEESQSMGFTFGSEFIY